MKTSIVELCMSEIVLNPIGIIHSPFKDTKGVPIQPTAAKGIEGTIVIQKEYVEGLKDLDGFSHIILLYNFHLSIGYSLTVKPFLDDKLHGVFSTRAPRRPNPLGISIVRLLSIEGNILSIKDVDIVDGTPLLDIKPYVPEFDSIQTANIGWLSDKVKQAHHHKADDRFKE
jgi:tRNA-Thr(GGU) m(6)t(6)A37 methyltransferase TsaA